MSTAWVMYKLPEFARDFVRDFCLSSEILEKEFRHIEDSGQVRIDAIKVLFGSYMNKGMLWRLQDTSRHFFQNDAKDCPVGQLLEWSIGYLVYETRKMQESIRQIDQCTPEFMDLSRHLSPQIESFANELLVLIDQSKDSLRTEMGRIRFILSHCRQLIPQYFEAHRDNELLARFMVERNDLVREVFHEDYQTLIDGIYGQGSSEDMYILAAASLRAGGWFQDAHQALEKAAQINPENPKLLAERQELCKAPWHDEDMLDRR